MSVIGADQPGVGTISGRLGDGSPRYSPGSLRVFRGGGWNCLAIYCRSSGRFSYLPGQRLSNWGFRLLRTE